LHIAKKQGGKVTNQPITDDEIARHIADNLLPDTREDTLAALLTALQTAVEIELATVPIYLSVYYSIKRTERTGENMTDLDVFADKAGGMVMSVAVEEMLHLSLSANILHSLGGDPQLYGHSPDPYPSGLPHHNPVGPPGPGGPDDTAVEIPLAKFSYEQLWHLLQIEYPSPVGALPQDTNWDTIGQFYMYITALINSPFITDADFQVRGAGAEKFQIQSYNYSPNNIDTAHPETPFDPWAMPGQPGGASDVARYSNADDSFHGPSPLTTITSKQLALDAIATISDQGEGANHGAYADDSELEASHYWKFLTLQSELEHYAGHIEHLAPLPVPPEPAANPITDAELATIIANFPDNPTTAGYLAYFEANGGTNYAPLSDLINGIYQYMLILIETIFKVEDAGPDASGQKLFFNEALHRSMIWMLDKLIRGNRNYDLGNGNAVAPTFENISLGARHDAYSNLLALADACEPYPYFNDISYYIDTIKTLPDVSSYWAPADHAPAATPAGPPPNPPGPGTIVKFSSAPATDGEPVPVPYPYPDPPVPAFPAHVGSQPAGLPAHSCMGLNSCRGSDRFGVDGPPGGSPNECAGQGYCSTTADHTCHVQNECRNQGGCGLYGTADELSHPGVNDCKSLGSCATPINAERFITNGPNRGASVWKQARQVFEQRWSNDTDGTRSSIPNAPDQLGPAPDPFAETGPPYLWVSNDNNNRGAMTSCGASGLSGAGGCSA